MRLIFIVIAISDSKNTDLFLIIDKSLSKELLIKVEQRIINISNVKND